MKVDNRHRIIGGHHRALSRYYMILNRVKDQKNPKNRSYLNVPIDLDKDNFIDWFMANDYKGCSVDRIDVSKGYSMDNIQLIPIADNIRKDKIKASSISCECFRCGHTKPINLFAKDLRRLNGRSTICKQCDSDRKSRKNGKGKIYE